MQKAEIGGNARSNTNRVTETANRQAAKRLDVVIQQDRD